MSLRILHVPCNTPYVRKIRKECEFEIVNGLALSGIITIPMEITYRWILEQRENVEFWESFDICHLHYGFEFESIETVQEALALIRSHKPIVYTCHELCSMHGVSQEKYATYLALIVKNAASVVTLTESAKNALLTIHPEISMVTVIPHGYVISPENQFFGGNRPSGRPPEVLFFGALRANRDITTSIVNVTADSSLMCRVRWVTRPFTQEQLIAPSTLRIALEISKNSNKTSLELTLPSTDDEVALRVGKSNVIVLPNLFAGHSGQLEIAFDCGLLPVVTNAGFLDSQWKAWPEENARVPRVVVANWSDGKEWFYQARLLAAIREALALFPTFASSVDVEARKRFRTREHEQVLKQHLAVYSAVVRGGKQ